MEKSHNVYVVPSEFGWSDLGTWGALSNHIKLDENGNAIQGNNTVLYHSSDNIVKFPNDKLVILYGLNGFIVVENEGELLICKRDDEQEIKNIVSQLKKVRANNSLSDIYIEFCDMIYFVIFAALKNINYEKIFTSLSDCFSF